MKIKFFIILALTISILSLVLACSENDDYNNVDVEVINTFNTYQMAYVKYTVENLGTKTVKGWKIFFNVNFERGSQLIASESVYFTLEPGEISSIKQTFVRIPTYYDKAVGAFLKRIETW